MVRALCRRGPRVRRMEVGPSGYAVDFKGFVGNHNGSNRSYP